MPINHSSLSCTKLMRAVFKSNLSLFRIGDDDVNSGQQKDRIPNKWWTPVQLLKWF